MTLRLGFYPYTYARVAVMKGSLIKPDQWHSLLKMGVNELLRMLQDGNYKKEIDELGADKRNLTALEMALNKNMIRTLAKLKRISDEKVQEVLRVYFLRYDMENFKTIIRGKAAEISNEEIEQLLTPSINYSQEFLLELIKKETIQEIVRALPFDVKKEEDLFEIENGLDRVYVEKLIDLSNQLKGQGRAFKEFLKAELDILNIKIILRLKHENMDNNDIRRYVIHPRKEIAQLIEKDFKGIMKTLRKMKILSLNADNKSESELFTQAEIELDTSLLRREVLLMHKFPLTVNVILGFMFAKEIEVKNLKVLLKGKQLGLDNAYLEKLMAVA
jgi:V/A-type H+/Na+-transporting ATPase subunit C